MAAITGASTYTQANDTNLAGGIGKSSYAPDMSNYTDSAQKIRNAWISRHTPVAGANPPTITMGAVGAVSTINGRSTSSPQTSVTLVPDGYSCTFNLGGSWIYGNHFTNAFTYSQGSSKLFQFTGSKFDFISSNPGTPGVGPDFRIRYKEAGGEWEVGPLIEKNGADWASAGTRYILVDFGAAATRTIEVIGGELPFCSGFNFSADGTMSSTTDRADDPRIMLFGDSYVWGQGATEASATMPRQLGLNLGTLDCYNHGRRTNGFYEAPSNTTPSYPDRAVGRLSPTKMLPEPVFWGPLDLICINGTINDGGVAAATLQEYTSQVFRVLRGAQPNALIVFTAHTHSPDSRIGSAQQQAYINGFNAVLADDPGAILLNAVAEDWIPVGAKGSSPYFPATGDDVHPNDLGHAYFGMKIANGVLGLLDNILGEMTLGYSAFQSDAVQLNAFQVLDFAQDYPSDDTILMGGTFRDPYRQADRLREAHRLREAQEEVIRLKQEQQELRLKELEVAAAKDKQTKRQLLAVARRKAELEDEVAKAMALLASMQQEISNDKMAILVLSMACPWINLGGAAMQ